MVAAGDLHASRCSQRDEGHSSQQVARSRSYHRLRQVAVRVVVLLC